MLRELRGIASRGLRVSVQYGSEPNARLLRRKIRDASRGSPRSLAALGMTVKVNKRLWADCHIGMRASQCYGSYGGLVRGG
jgi:hypothetical protein